MKVEIHASPVFYLHLSREQVEFLMHMSDRHYDHHCQSVSKQGGFLYGWKNHVEFSPDETVPCRAIFRELDTIAKILEMVINCRNDNDRTTHRDICRAIRVLFGSETIAKINGFKQEIST